MQVLVNSNHSVEMNQRTIAWASSEVEKTLDRFSGLLTRVELHFNDTNSGKGGDKDKYCSIEAHLAGFSNLACSHKAETFDLALDGAVEKLEKAIDKTMGRINYKKGRTPMGGEPFAALGSNDEESEMESSLK